MALVLKIGAPGPWSAAHSGIEAAGRAVSRGETGPEAVDPRAFARASLQSDVDRSASALLRKVMTLRVSEQRRLPLIAIQGILIVLMRGPLSDRLAAQISADMTSAIERGMFSGLVIDLSSADILDSHDVRCIGDLARCAQLMGLHTAVSGMQPSITAALVRMGLSLPGVLTASDLEQAMKLLRYLGGGNLAATAKPRVSGTAR